MKKIFILISLLYLNYNANSQITDTALCDRIEKTYDEFEKETTFRTPSLISFNCSFLKVISKTDTRYYLSLEAKGSTLNIAERGVKIILSNNQILSFPESKIDVDVSSGEYEYSAFIRISSEKLAILKKNKILKWKLYIYDNEQDDGDAELFRNWLNCMTTMK